MRLRASMSRNRTAAGGRARRPPTRRWSSRSLNSARLGSPVSASCSAGVKHVAACGRRRVTRQAGVLGEGDERLALRLAGSAAAAQSTPPPGCRPACRPGGWERRRRPARRVGPVPAARPDGRGSPSITTSRSSASASPPAPAPTRPACHLLERVATAMPCEATIRRTPGTSGSSRRRPTTASPTRRPTLATMHVEDLLLRRAVGDHALDGRRAPRAGAGARAISAACRWLARRAPRSRLSRRRLRSDRVRTARHAAQQGAVLAAEWLTRRRGR